MTMSAVANSASLTNWAGNVRFRHRRYHAPESLVQLQAVVRTSSKLRCVGTRHSFSAVADTDADDGVSKFEVKVVEVRPLRLSRCRPCRASQLGLLAGVGSGHPLRAYF